MPIVLKIQPLEITYEEPSGITIIDGQDYEGEPSQLIIPEERLEMAIDALKRCLKLSK